MKRILLIDDDEISNFLNKSMIKKSGLFEEVHVLNNAVFALEFLKELESASKPFPDVILLDLMMPVMDGFEFLKELDKMDSRLQKSLKIVMLTSSLDPKDRISALNNPKVIGFLSKPINQTKISELLGAKD